jgi:hypothetical protein
MEENPSSKHIHSNGALAGISRHVPSILGKREDVDHLNQGFSAYKFIHILLNI